MIPSFETYQRVHQALEIVASGKIDHLDCGRHELTEEIYVNVMEYETKEAGVFEAHHRYIDIHYLIHGTERIEIANESKLDITVPYDENEDYVLGTASGEQYTIKEKVPFVVMPGEAHRPGLKLGECAQVKKAVLKVPL